MDHQPIIEAAKSAGEIIKRYFGETLEIEGKTSPCDFRTKADLESEKIIIEALEKYYPGYSILSEERGFIDKNSEYRFVVDPLDGTNNFSVGLPNFTVSIALQKRVDSPKIQPQIQPRRLDLMVNQETIFGVIYQPITGQIFQAVKGKGAFCDGNKISVNAEKDFKNSSIAVSIGYASPREILETTMTDCYSMDCKRWMNNWSVAYDLCLLALGRIEAMIVCDAEIYDFAAGKLIAEEAGAMITGLTGKPVGDTDCRFMVTNGHIHQELLKLCKKIRGQLRGALVISSNQKQSSD